MSSERIRIRTEEVLSDDWYIFKKTTFDYRRADGTWQTQTRETYDRGNGATILLYNRDRRSVVLTRQFRFPAFVNGHEGWLIETPAGLLDGERAEERIRQETEEETGFQVREVRRVFDAYMSPGSVTEKVHFFVGEYQPESKVRPGGGIAAEGEDIEVLELSFDGAMRRIETGEIADGKTILLLQYAALRLFGEVIR
jgi:nudix-type nucleoside diphosphatase (YffH/AdpP family)